MDTKTGGAMKSRDSRAAEVEMEMNLNPIYTLSGLGVNTVDEIKERERLQKMREQSILRDNARLKQQMQDAERKESADTVKLSKKKSVEEFAARPI